LIAITVKILTADFSKNKEFKLIVNFDQMLSVKNSLCINVFCCISKSCC